MKIELAKENNLYNHWCSETGRKKLENYFDDYCDRDIVTMFLSDMIQDPSINWKVKKVWDDGCLNWPKTKITIS